MKTATDLAADAIAANGGDPERAAVWALTAVLEELDELSPADVALSLEGVLVILKGVDVVARDRQMGA